MAQDDTTRERGRHAEPRPQHAEPPREREPNAVDHYSLALQIIQVFPIVTEPIVLVLPSAWIARIVAGIALLGGTTLVIWTERHRHTRTLRRHRKPTGLCSMPPGSDRGAESADPQD